MFCDKMLHRSKLEEPQLLTHVTVFASIMQSTACGGGRRRWEKKAFVTRGRGRNTNSSLKCILKKITFKIIYMKAATVVNLTKQQTESAECFDAKDVGKQSTV